MQRIFRLCPSAWAPALSPRPVNGKPPHAVLFQQSLTEIGDGAHGEERRLHWRNAPGRVARGARKICPLHVSPRPCNSWPRPRAGEGGRHHLKVNVDPNPGPWMCHEAVAAGSGLDLGLALGLGRARRPGSMRIWGRRDWVAARSAGASCCCGCALTLGLSARGLLDPKPGTCRGGEATTCPAPAKGGTGTSSLKRQTLYQSGPCGLPAAYHSRW